MHSCDVDRVGLDGADLIERLTDRCARYAEEIAVAQEKTRWIPVTERLPEANELEEAGGMSKVVLGIAKNDSGFSLFNPCLCVYLSDGRWIFRGKPVTVTPLDAAAGTAGGGVMSVSKSKREAVYRKYDGHCAYCGREIAYKDMQVDHFQPLRAWGIEDAGTDDLDNLMPACRMCNHYKRANSLETFRRYIAEIPRKLRENYIYKVGIVYGEIAEQAHPVKFYFEQQEAMKDAKY